MDKIDIGDLTVEAVWGDCLRLTIAEQQDTTTLTVAGVDMLMEYLAAWKAAQQEKGVLHG